jgi:hypothetical protein
MEPDVSSSCNLQLSQGKGEHLWDAKPTILPFGDSHAALSSYRCFTLSSQSYPLMDFFAAIQQAQ